MNSAGSSSALRRAVPFLRCPVCAMPVEPMDAGADSPESTSASAPAPDAPVTGVRCSSGHSFDRARQGHLTLLGPRGRRFQGDTTDQVLARERVLGSGAFDPVVAMLAGIADDATRSVADPVIVEAGAGTGFYLARVLAELRAASERIGHDGLDEHDGHDRLDGHAGHDGHAGQGGLDEKDGLPAKALAGTGPLGIGTEISVAAARRLAKCSTDVAALVADTWDGLPLADSSVNLVQVVFAPRNAAEFARVLVPGGTLVVAGPGERHLEPLRTAAGMLTPEAGKADRLEAGLAEYFTPGALHEVDTIVTVPDSIAVDLALMGPSGVHLDRTDLEREFDGREQHVRLHVEARTFHPAI